MSISEPVKHVADASALTTSALAFFQIVPDVTAMLSLVWIVIRLYETKTVQKLLNKEQKEIIREHIEEP